MDSLGWIGRAFRALVGSDRLPEGGCLKACALLGAWAGLAAGVSLLAPPPSPEWQRRALTQVVVAGVVVAGAGLAWLWRPAMRPFLVLASCGLVAAVVWYPWFMTGALARQGESGVKHFAHAPGVLALGLAFGLRLVLDYGLVAEKTRRQCARYVGIAGLVLGGCLDAFVMYQMVQLF